MQNKTFYATFLLVALIFLFISFIPKIGLFDVVIGIMDSLLLYYWGTKRDN